MSYTVEGKQPRHAASTGPKKSRIKIYATVVAVLIIGGFVINNHLKTHQTLYLVNHFPVEAKVSITGGDEYTVASTTVKEVTLAEGKYSLTMKVAGLADQALDIELKNTLLERLSGETAFVVNVGKGAVLVWEEATYSENPDPNAFDPHKLYVGDGFLTLKGIDYKFENFPVSLKIKAGQKVKKHRVRVAAGVAGTLVNLLEMSRVEANKILSFSEVHMLVQPTNDELVKKYTNLCLKYKALDRGRAFLEQQFNHKPVLVEWHRGYQVLSQRQGQVEDLIKKYDDKVQEDSENSAFLYLRGRISPSSTEAITYYDRSIAADANNPYPWYAKGFTLASRLDYTGAKEAVQRACQLKPDSNDMADFLKELRFARREYDALENEAKEELKTNPFSYSAQSLLLYVYALQGKTTEIKTLRDEFVNKLQKTLPGDPYQLGRYMDLRIAYIQRDFPGYLKIAQSLQDNYAKHLAIFSANLVQQRFAEAEMSLQKISEQDAAFNYLLLWLGWKVLANDEQQAGPWLQKALASFSKGSIENREIARLFAGSWRNVVAGLDNIPLPLGNKAIVATALAERFPRRRRQLVSRAETMNFNIRFPHYFLQQVLQQIRR